ncbi:Zn-dependent hydrolase [Halobiforma lacisalsi AJ5]|uniref:Hydantoinase/carbamoylase family amidase n=1 Tax=Natronobacterium lacisalsi AJ5 TaxID=358396 RepID=M0LSG7_NATLA|nr:M20 family metallo-hydrolase [Halobiforma lacisalsi]APW99743.1 Zn-dependent hydrolase [Halobiforma lacisalsi AJ5]EMA36083.1 hydantoinase/carbamoylase family amidase [Halobiforma lacisalsi AJ5]
MSTDRNADGIDKPVAVDAERLRSDLERNAEFGAIDAEEGRGRTVLTGTEPNRRARDYLVDRLEDAGLSVSVDAVGNVVGTWTPDSADPDSAPVAAGSHLDSVPEGGIFDGPLGVYAALEAVRMLQESDVEPARPVAVVSFTEEEGTRFAGGMLGSSVATGHRSVEDALAVTDDEGTTLEDALAEIGYRGEGRLEADQWDGFLELHVEQDTRLEERGIPVGVVSTITGIVHATARFVGEADHAGTTAMADRTDALAAASEFVLDIERAGREFAMDGRDGETETGTAVATVGKSHVTPNATNVVPGAVELGVDLRDVEAATMDRLLERARRCLARLEADRGVETDLEVELEVEPAPMSERCREAVAAGADAAGVDSLSMHSGAAHDAMYVSRVTDAGMLFAPSEDGLSHTPREWTDWADCATAARVLGEAIARLAGE